MIDYRQFRRREQNVNGWLGRLIRLKLGASNPIEKVSNPPTRLSRSVHDDWLQYGLGTTASAHSFDAPY
jgi:hypothetical protein